MTPPTAGVRSHANRSAIVAFLFLMTACGDESRTVSSVTTPAPDDATVAGRVVAYFEKSVSAPPGIHFQVTKLEDSGIPGWRKGVLQASLGQQTQDVGFYVSADGHYLLRGEAVDLTIDPLKQVSSKIKLDGEPTRGPKDAKVTIVEYSDFQCPYCERAYDTLESQVLKEYGDRVRFVFKNCPLTNIHPWAEDAALAVECAFQQGSDQFWGLYNGLFAHQNEITKDNLRAKVTEIAAARGADTAKLIGCLDGHQSADALKADLDEAAALGVDSTPTFFINGRRLSGAQTFDSFKALIDRELESSG
jgi:protein-disulfide isomerase